MSARTSRNRVALAALLAAGAALGAVAVRARERSWTAPEREAPRSIPIALSGEVPEGYEARTLSVEGICCQGCSAKLHGALLALDGVREAAVDPLKAEASVVVRSGTTNAALEAALTFDKYSATAR